MGFGRRVGWRFGVRFGWRFGVRRRRGAGAAVVWGAVVIIGRGLMQGLMPMHAPKPTSPRVVGPIMLRVLCYASAGATSSTASGGGAPFAGCWKGVVGRLVGAGVSVGSKQRRQRGSYAS